MVDHSIIGKARTLDSKNRAAPREAGQTAAQTPLRNFIVRTLLILTPDTKATPGTSAPTGSADLLLLPPKWSVLCPRFRVPGQSLCHKLHPSCQGAEKVNKGNFPVLRWKANPAFHREPYSREPPKHKKGKSEASRQGEALITSLLFNFVYSALSFTENLILGWA